MRVLVTGSSGRVGSAICSSLASRYQLVGIDIRPGEYTDHLVDVGDQDAVEELLLGADAVVHTASLHARQVREEDDPERTSAEEGEP